MTAFRVDGLVALITGAGSGIGRATALELASLGAADLLLVGRAAAKLEETATLIARQASACKTAVMPADLYDPQDRQRLIDKVVFFGRLDILVNNAGFINESPLRATTAETWQQTMELNLTAPFDLLRGLVDLLAKSSQASVINISSTLAVKPIPRTTAYNASKAALGQMTRSLALELGGEGIRVNAVLPSIVDTPLYRSRYVDTAAFERNSDAVHRMHPLGRMGQPEDIAHAVAFLASPASAWITGVELPVDGGMLLT